MVIHQCYRIPEWSDKQVKASTPRVGLKKVVRLLIRNARAAGVDIFTITNNKLTLVDADGFQHEYIVSIVKPTGEGVKSIYYKLDYEIEVYRKQNNL